MEKDCACLDRTITQTVHFQDEHGTPISLISQEDEPASRRTLKLMVSELPVFYGTLHGIRQGVSMLTTDKMAAHVDEPRTWKALWSMVDALFVHCRCVNRIYLDEPLVSALSRYAEEIPILFSGPTSDHNLKRGAYLCRKTFYQWPEPWMVNPGVHKKQPEIVVSNGVQHPKRPGRPQGTIYRRYIHALGLTLSFRAVNPARDLDTFHEWMNQTRVAEFWELAKSKEELAKYLEGRNQDPHQFPVIGEFDNEPFGYFEIYWTMEDRLGPYYEADAFDRGMHVLVGNPKFLGKRFTQAWLTGLCHYLFLDHPDTNNIMGEPRSDNNNMLRYQKYLPYWKKLYDFDFPHKRASLMCCPRADFFGQAVLP